MKKIKQATVSALSGIFGIIALGGCSADEITGRVDGNAVIEVTTDAPVSGDSHSRAAVDPTEYTSGQIGINWLPEDKIGVYGDKNTANTIFSNLSNTESSKTSFAGRLADGEKALYAYYPYSTMAGDDPAAVKGNLPERQYYSTASREVKCDWKVGVPVPGSDSRFKFEHIFVFLKFELNATGSPLLGESLRSVALQIDGKQLCGDFTCNLADGKCTFVPSADCDRVVMEWIDTPMLGSGTINGYLNCATVEGINGKDVKVAVTTDRHIATFDVPVKVDCLQPNMYYTVPLRLADFKDIWTLEDNPDAPAEENAAWVTGMQSRLACANTVFALPGKPFMHKIRVPQSTLVSAHDVVPVKTGVVRAYNLPEGLTWNAERCLVEGTAPAAGEYAYSVEFELNGVTYKEGVRLTVSDNLVSPTPMMGWQSWNVLKGNISESIINAQGDAMVNLGLRDCGYVYIGIDDRWQTDASSRDASTGYIIHDKSKFPNGLKPVTDYLHGLGLKAGIYSDAGTVTCEGLAASYGHEDTDARAFTEWGFDMLKEDWFWSGHGDSNGSLDPTSTSLAMELYGRMSAGIKSAGNKVLLYMCEWGTHEPWRWAPEIGVTTWRMSYDARDGWMGTNGKTWGKAENNPSSNSSVLGIGLKNTIDLMRNLWSYTGINRYNDADMLCVGIRGKGQSSSDLVDNGGMSDDEYETNFAMWCMYSSPLLLSIDMTSGSLNDHDMALMKNEELIALNQDALGQGAEWVKTVGNMDYYQKDLANGDVAIAVVNLGNSSGSYSISLSDYDALDSSAIYDVRDVMTKSDAGRLSASSTVSGSLNKHAVRVVRLSRN